MYWSRHPRPARSEHTAPIGWTRPCAPNSAGSLFPTSNPGETAKGCGYPVTRRSLIPSATWRESSGDLCADSLQVAQSRLRRTAIKVSLAGLVIAGLLSLLATRAVIKPVVFFKDAARRVESGDLDFQVDYTGSPEIAEFATVFDSMVTGLRESRARLLELATRDVVTGLFNHMYFQERLGTEIDRSERSTQKLCLIILDVDRFKAINDTKGHPVGDYVLRQLAESAQDDLPEHRRNRPLRRRRGGNHPSGHGSRGWSAGCGTHPDGRSRLSVPCTPS